MAFFAQMKAMVGPKDNNRTFGKRRIFQRFQNATHLGVGEADTGKVASHGFLPFARILGGLHFVTPTFCPLPRYRGNIVEVVFGNYWQLDFRFSVEIVKAFGYIPCLLYTSDAADE